MLLVAACGTAAENDTGLSTATSPVSATASSAGSAVPDSTSGPSPQTSTDPGTGPNIDTSSGHDGDSGIDYVPWGPDDPPIPGQYAALAASSGTRPDCDQLDNQAPDGEFWTTVIAVCRAITGDGDWPAATVPPAPPPPANAYQACLDEELSAMLRDALGWHAAHPGAQPNVSYPNSSDLSPCQTRIYHAYVYPAGTQTHPVGGIVVELAVPGLDDTTNPSVFVDGSPVEIDDDFGGASDGLSTGAIFVPAPIEAHTATIEITTRFGPLVTTLELPKVDANPDVTTTGIDEPTTHEPTTTSSASDEPPPDGTAP